jgi:hypothetical protein
MLAAKRDPVAAALGIVSMAAALVENSPTGRAALALEMVRAALELDPHVAAASMRWQ